MNKIIILILVLLFLPIISAEQACGDRYCFDYTIGKPSGKSTSDTYNFDYVINSMTNDDTKGHLYKQIIEAIEIRLDTGGPAKKKAASTIYYDVIADIDKDRYRINDMIKAEITIINKGWEPDRDGILVSYLIDSDGNKFRERRVEFELVPPTCPRADYDYAIDKCIGEFNSTFEPLKTVIKRNMTLPPESIEGEWRFMVEYETQIQPMITAYDSFSVIRYQDMMWMMVLVVMGGLIYFVYLEEKKRADNQHALLLKVQRGYGR